MSGHATALVETGGPLRTVNAHNPARRAPAWGSGIRPTPPTDTTDEPAMIRWLLIELWDQAGPDYMKAWAEDYLAKNPPPPGYRV
jgi:hypothetical protein